MVVLGASVVVVGASVVVVDASMRTSSFAEVHDIEKIINRGSREKYFRIIRKFAKKT